jgi:hypothetical protein
VHAARAIAARDRQRLEQLCRYLSRPPIAQDRLELCADGRVRYTMKKPWRDGTLSLLFEPEDLVARLCAMVPPPRWHLIRFHGALSAHASLRPLVVPQPPPPPSDETTRDNACAGAQLELFSIASANATTDSDAPSREPSRKPWAWLLRHVFAEDLQTCAHCGGRMRWKEVATTPEHIARLLVRHGLGPDPPNKPRTPRFAVPEQLPLGFKS